MNAATPRQSWHKDPRWIAVLLHTGLVLVAGLSLSDYWNFTLPVLGWLPVLLLDFPLGWLGHLLLGSGCFLVERLSGVPDPRVLDFSTVGVLLRGICIGLFGGIQWFYNVSLVLWIARAPWRTREPWSCVKCEYNLTGNVSGVCPECGTPVPVDPTVGLGGTRSEAGTGE